MILNQASEKFRDNAKDFIEQKIFSEKFVSQRDFDHLKKQFLNLKTDFEKLRDSVNAKKQEHIDKVE